MKPQVPSISGGMLWGTLPLAGGLLMWEHTLNLGEIGHELVQIALLVLVFGWAYFWYRQAEYARLRRYAVRDPGNERFKYRVNATSTFVGHAEGIDPVTFHFDRAKPDDGMTNSLPSGNGRHSIEDQFHVSSN